MNTNEQKIDNKDPNLVVALDIGTSKILAAVAEVQDKKVIVRGLSSQKTYGVKAGVITDIQQVTTAIRKAVKHLEKQNHCTIYSLSASVTGKDIDCIESKAMIPINGKAVTHQDRDSVLESAKNVALPQDSEIIDVIPQEYEIDKQVGITNPIGMTGIRLDVQALVITSPSNVLNSARTCIQNSNFDVDNFVYQGIASSLAVLTEDEKRLGVCLVDIGGGTVDIAIYSDGVIRDVFCIPYAGDRVTLDIARLMHMSSDVAESFKVKFGSCRSDLVAFDEMVELPMQHTIKSISRYELARIIEARYEDFFGLIRQELKRNYYDHALGAGLVFTGGGSHIADIEQAAEEYFNLPARLGYVQNVSVGSEVLDQNLDMYDPKYATVIGLLKTQQDNYLQNKKREADEPKLSFFQRFRQGLKQYF